MRLLYLGIIVIFSGFLLLMLGGVQAGIFIIFPFIISSGPLGFAGAIVIFAGFMMIFFGMMPSAYEREDIEPFRAEKGVDKRGIGVVFIGPVPLIIDSKNRTLSLISLGIFLLALLIIFLFYLGALA